MLKQDTLIFIIFGAVMIIGGMNIDSLMVL